LTKHELLPSDAKAVAVAQGRQPAEGRAVQEHAVAAAQVFDDHSVAANDDPHVPARDQWIVEGHVAVDAASDGGDAERQVELVEEKAEAVA
jgi:hypothetical protein